MSSTRIESPREIARMQGGFSGWCCLAFRGGYTTLYIVHVLCLFELLRINRVLPH